MKRLIGGNYMGDVYWMTAILIIQAVISVIICTMLAKNTQSVIEETNDTEK